MSLRRHIVNPIETQRRVADLLELVERERLARELHTTAGRLGQCDRRPWADLTPLERADYLRRAAIAIRLGHTGARNVALEKIAAVVALALAAPEPLSDVQAYGRSRQTAREAFDALINWLGRES